MLEFVYIIMLIYKKYTENNKIWLQPMQKMSKEHVPYKPAEQP